ncbi:glycerophosphodiester phosphodiesterase family protein [Tannerella forsythia]
MEQSMAHIAVISHAGGPYGPPNSLKAIEGSMRAGVDAIEIDIQMSKDGALVVFHDESIDRLTDGSGKIKDLTLDELQQHSLRNSDRSLSTERIPTLAAVVDHVNKRVPLILEVKDYENEKIPSQLAEFIRRRDLYKDVVVISFGYNCLKAIHEIDSTITCQYLLNRREQLDDLLENKFISTILIDYNSFDAEIVRKIHQKRKKVITYTLNSQKTIPAGLYSIVDGIITDDPELWMGIRMRNMLYYKTSE